METAIENTVFRLAIYSNYHSKLPNKIMFFIHENIVLLGITCDVEGMYRSVFILVEFA